MNLTDTYEILAQYNQWMNQKLYALCAELPDSVRKEDRGAFFKSIHATLDHILWADRVWLARFQHQPPIGKIGQVVYEDFEQLRHQREQMDRDLIAWAQQLTPNWFTQSFTWTSSDGSTRTQPNWVLVTHPFNHQTHHRGQVTTLLSQLGYDPGVTDLPKMPLPD